MGLFSEASLKAYPPQSPSARLEPLEKELRVSGTAAAPLRICEAIEAPLDLLWSRLRHHARAPSAARALVAAHWAPQEGATTLAVALAWRAATLEPMSSFCLVDFDLFSAGMSFLASLEAEPGASNVLIGKCSLEQATAGTILPNLKILPAGYPTVGRHVAQLADRCQELCRILMQRYTYVVLDTPCLSKHPNFAFWAGGLAQAVLVVRAGQARKPAVAKALGTLDLMRLDVAAVALNARQYYVPAWLYQRT